MKKKRETWDRLGIFASVACAAHCLVTPFVFLLLPKFSTIWAHPASHALVALFVLPVAGTVLRSGYKRHGKKWVGAAALVGIGFIVVGSVLPYTESSEPSAGAAVQAEELPCASCCPQLVDGEGGDWSLKIPTASIVTILGSLFLIGSHLGNLFACRCCGPQNTSTKTSNHPGKGTTTKKENQR